MPLARLNYQRSETAAKRAKISLIHCYKSDRTECVKITNLQATELLGLEHEPIKAPSTYLSDYEPSLQTQALHGKEECERENRANQGDSEKNHGTSVLVEEYSHA